MEEIKVKNNPRKLKVYTIGEPETSGEEYNLLVSSFVDKLEELFGTRNGRSQNHAKEENDAV